MNSEYGRQRRSKKLFGRTQIVCSRRQSHPLNLTVVYTFAYHSPSLCLYSLLYSGKVALVTNSIVFLSTGRYFAPARRSWPTQRTGDQAASKRPPHLPANTSSGSAKGFNFSRERERGNHGKPRAAFATALKASEVKNKRHTGCPSHRPSRRPVNRTAPA